MLKIWLKLVLKGRCARKSRPRLKGSLVATRTIVRMIGASSRLFKKNSLFFYFLPVDTPLKVCHVHTPVRRVQI